MTLNKLLYYSFIGVFLFLPIATSPGVGFGIIAICIWVFSGLFWKERKQWIYQSWFIPTLILLLLPWIGLFYTENIHYGLKLAQKSYLWFCALTLVSLQYKKNTTLYLIISFLVGLAFTATISILEATNIVPDRWLNIFNLHKEFPVGFLDQTGHISLSLFLVLGMLMLSFYLHRAISRRIQILIIAGLCLYFFDLLLVQGRTGYLAFLLLSPLFFYNLFGRKRWLVVCAGTLIAVMLVLLAPPVQHRIQEVINEVNQFKAGNPETSIGVRLYIWQGAWKVLQAHPFFGVGTGDFGMEIKKMVSAGTLPPISVEVTQTFNTFLHLVVSYGIYSVLFLFWLLWLLIKNGTKYRDQDIGFFILAYTLIFIIGSFTDMLLIRHQTFYLFTLIIGLQSALIQNKNKEN